MPCLPPRSASPPSSAFPPRSTPQPVAACLEDDVSLPPLACRLATPPAIVAGDVLLVKGQGRLAAIGAAGGLMGHVMVAYGVPRRVLPTSPEAKSLFAVQPRLRAEQLWRVDAFESTRSNAGLHFFELLLHPEHGTGRLVLVAEMTKAFPGSGVPEEKDLLLIDDEAAEVWQSPAELRSSLRPEIMSQVLREMKASEQSWSIATAARAVLSKATVRGEGDQDQLLEDLKACWRKAPICTSVVVVFWQQYLCRLAREACQSELDLLLRWMPLKADRGLPGELIDTMQRCRWVLLECLPGEDFAFCASRVCL